MALSALRAERERESERERITQLRGFTGVQDGKDTMPKILRDNSAIVLYQVGSEVYCSDANSTAFKFPLIDANIIERECLLHY